MAEEADVHVVLLEEGRDAGGFKVGADRGVMGHDDAMGGSLVEQLKANEEALHFAFKNFVVIWLGFGARATGLEVDEVVEVVFIGVPKTGAADGDVAPAEDIVLNGVDGGGQDGSHFANGVPPVVMVAFDHDLGAGEMVDPIEVCFSFVEF